MYGLRGLTRRATPTPLSRRCLSRLLASPSLSSFPASLIIRLVIRLVSVRRSTWPAAGTPAEGAPFHSEGGVGGGRTELAKMLRSHIRVYCNTVAAGCHHVTHTQVELCFFLFFLLELRLHACRRFFSIKQRLVSFSESHVTKFHKLQMLFRLLFRAISGSRPAVGPNHDFADGLRDAEQLRGARPRAPCGKHCHWETSLGRRARMGPSVDDGAPIISYASYPSRRTQITTCVAETLEQVATVDGHQLALG